MKEVKTIVVGLLPYKYELMARVFDPSGISPASELFKEEDLSQR